MDLKVGIVKISTKESIGTGIIVEKSGIVFTCHHIFKSVLGENDSKKFVEVYNTKTGKFEGPKYDYEILFPSEKDNLYEHDFAIIKIVHEDSSNFETAPVCILKDAFKEVGPLKLVGLSKKNNWSELKTKNGNLIDIGVHNKSICLHIEVTIKGGMSGGPVYSTISKCIIGITLTRNLDVFKTGVKGYKKIDFESYAISMFQIKQIINETMLLSSDIKERLLKIFPTEDLKRVISPFSKTNYCNALKDSFKRKIEFYKKSEPALIKTRECIKLNFKENEYEEDPKEKIKAKAFLSKKGVIAVMGSMGLGKSIFILEIIESYFGKIYSYVKPFFWLELKKGIEYKDGLDFRVNFAKTCIRSITNPEYLGDEIEKQMIEEIEKYLSKNYKPIIILDGLDEYRGEEEVIKRFIKNLRKLGTLLIFGREENIKSLDFRNRTEYSYFFNEIFRLSYLDDGAKNEVNSYITNFANWKKIDFYNLPSVHQLRQWAPHGRAPELSYRNPLVLKALLTKPSERKERLTEYEILEKLSLSTFEWYVGKKLKEPDTRFELNSRFSSQPAFIELDGISISRSIIKICIFLLFEDLALSYRFNEGENHKIMIPIEDEKNFTVDSFIKLIDNYKLEKPECYDLKKFFLQLLTNTSGFVQFAGKDQYQILPDRMADFFILRRIKRFMRSENEKKDENLYTIIGSILGNSFMFRNLINMIIEENDNNSSIGEICDLTITKLDELSDLTNLYQINKDWKDLNYIQTNKGKIEWIDSYNIQLEKKLNSLKNLKNLKSLDFQYLNLQKVPNIAGLKKLELLNLSHNKLKSIPRTIGDLMSLTHLKIGNNKLRHLPKAIGNLNNLKSLSLHNNQLKSFPNSIGFLINLEYLYARRNEIHSLPNSIGNLTFLKSLYLGNNRLNQLPRRISLLKSLIHFDLTENLLESLPKEIGDIFSLKYLYIARNRLKSIPNTIGNLKNLNVLNLRNNKLTKLPNSLGEIPLLEKLNLSENELNNLPDTLGNLRSLKVLNLRTNNLHSLPDSISNLNSLEILDISVNKLKFLPESMDKLVNLKILNISDNFIEKLPLFLLKLKSIKKITLSDHSLKSKNHVENNQILSILEQKRKVHYSDSLNSFIPENLKKYGKELVNRVAKLTTLESFGLPVLLTIVDLLNFLEIEMDTLKKLIPSDRYLISSNYPYRTFKFKKKTNGYRKISAPKNNLKFVQQKIYKKILLKIIPSKYAHGFRPNHSTVTNAKTHLKAKIIYNLDIKNFFPSIKFDKVLTLFKNAGYSGSISFLLSLLCTAPPRRFSKYNKKWGLSRNSLHYLPQGAPTSPFISNLVCLKMDNELASISKSYSYKFSRYADDLTFSSEVQNKVNLEFRKEVFDCIKRNGFKINFKKERFSKHFKRLNVTGLIIHDDYLTVPRRFTKNLRVALFQLKNSNARMEDLHSEIKNIEGRCSYALMVNKEKYLKYYKEFKNITIKLKNSSI